MKKTYHIKGMHCPSCEVLIRDKFSGLKNVISVKADYRKHEAYVRSSGEISRENIDGINKELKQFGYRVVDKDEDMEIREPILNKIFDATSIAVILFVLFFFAQELHLLPSFSAASGLTLTSVFVLGLVASTSTCMATSGALFLATVGKMENKNILSALAFNLGRIISYGFFGFVVGFLGKTIAVNLHLNALLTLVVSLAMILIGLDMLKIFSFSSLSLTSFTTKIFERLEKSLIKNPQKTAFFIGAITYLLPCGFTQTVQLYALGLADPVKSAITMMVFALGTTPLLMAVGFLSSFNQSKYYLLFHKVIAVLIVMIGVYYFSNFLGIYGLSPASFAAKQNNVTDENVKVENGVQVVKMTVNSSGYTPNFFTIKKGLPVKWLINGENVYGCQASFVVPSLGIQKTFQPGENVIEFTPKEAGTINFSCGMGMYRGSFEVI